ncbi:MAG: hypothetical protein R3247_17095 [Rhodothermales bacterium]|nr:hypothetical protein [Rhodothermales bacterium]
MALLILKHITTILHILFAAAWFGMGLRLAAQARTALAQPREAGVALAADGARTVRFMSIFALLTAVFAYATLGLGGPASYGLSFHLSSGLILVLLAVQYALIRPGWARLQTAVERGEGGEAARKRVAMGVGIGHLLWITILVLMFWPRLAAAFAAA